MVICILARPGQEAASLLGGAGMELVSNSGAEPGPITERREERERKKKTRKKNYTRATAPRTLPPNEERKERGTVERERKRGERGFFAQDDFVINFLLAESFLCVLFCSHHGSRKPTSVCVHHRGGSYREFLSREE